MVNSSIKVKKAIVYMNTNALFERNSTINIKNLNFLKFDSSMGGVRNHAISD